MSKTIARNIISQLGAGLFVAMTGAKDFVYSDDQLVFKIGKNFKKVTHVRITLNSRDLYDLEFINIRGMKTKVMSTSEDIYAEDLQEVFTEHTDLYTRM